MCGSEVESAGWWQIYTQLTTSEGMVWSWRISSKIFQVSTGMRSIPGWCRSTSQLSAKHWGNSCGKNGAKYLSGFQLWRFRSMGQKSTQNHRAAAHLPNNMTGWWLGHPSEKYESQLGWLFPICGKITNVPNHQPDDVPSTYDLGSFGDGIWTVTALWWGSRPLPTQQKWRYGSQ